MNVNKDNINVPGSKDAWEIATMINTSLDAAKSEFQLTIAVISLFYLLLLCF
eukprot:Pgem_evm1s11289